MKVEERIEDTLRIINTIDYHNQLGDIFKI